MSAQLEASKSAPQVVLNDQEDVSCVGLPVRVESLISHVDATERSVIRDGQGIRDPVVFCKASFLLVADLEAIADRFLPFRAVTVGVQELPNLPGTHQSVVTFLVQFQSR